MHCSFSTVLFHISFIFHAGLCKSCLKGRDWDFIYFFLRKMIQIWKWKYFPPGFEPPIQALYTAELFGLLIKMYKINMHQKALWKNSSNRYHWYLFDQNVTKMLYQESGRKPKNVFLELFFFFFETSYLCYYEACCINKGLRFFKHAWDPNRDRFAGYL